MRGASLRQLKAFATVARHLSFARAADELHLTPPAISLQVSQLEREVGLPLFERRGKSVSLTMPGEYLLVYARRMLATLKEADDAMARLRGAQTGRITIGMVSTAKYFLPRLLARFREEHRGVDMRLAVGNREQLVAMLRDAEVDLAVMGRPPREIEARAEAFAEHPHGIVASPQHRLAGRREIPPALLAGEEFIVREPGSGTRAAMEQFFRDSRIAPPQIMEMASNETIKQAVIANMGLAFISLHTAGLELQAGELVLLDVAGLPVRRRWHIVHLQGKPLSPATEALRYFVIENGEALINGQFGALATTLPAAEQDEARPPAPATTAPTARPGRATQANKAGTKAQLPAEPASATPAKKAVATAPPAARARAASRPGPAPAAPGRKTTPHARRRPRAAL